MISIITPSVRPEGIEIVDKSLCSQSYKDFVWYIGSPFEPNTKHPHVWVKDDFVGGFWSLNRIYNKMLSCVKDGYVVSWQDHTGGPSNLLDSLMQNMKTDRIISVAGNKLDGWIDPRIDMTRDDLHVCSFSFIEFNLAIIPLKAIADVGFFDEEADFLYFGMDGYSVMDRINEMGGYTYYLMQNPVTTSEVHGRAKDWEKENGIFGKYEKRKRSIIQKNKVYKL